MKELQMWRTAQEWLENSMPVVLYVVTNVRGSSPGKPTFKMVVNSDGESAGTVGGAVMEAELVLSAFEHELPRHIFLKHSPRAEESVRSGLHCAGTQELVEVALGDVATVKEIIECIEERTPKVLRIDRHGIHLLPAQDTEQGHTWTYSESEWQYEEIIGVPYQAVVFGGGHTGVALSRVLNFIDMHVTVIDHRPDLRMHRENRWAHRIYSGEFFEFKHLIPQGTKVFAVVCTPCIERDLEALEVLLDLNVRYIGLMGSKAKISQIFKRLSQEGYKDFRERINAPVGIEIKSRTVEEIAVSIAAEIISLKNS